MYDELLLLADELNTDVFYQKSIISKSYVVEVSKELYCINIDKSRIDSSNELNVSLAHELGHVISGTLYNNSTKKLYKGSAEYRADYRAAQILIPINKLIGCIKQGITEIYDLAEHFAVTDVFIERVLYIYGNKGLLTLEDSYE